MTEQHKVPVSPDREEGQENKEVHRTAVIQEAWVGDPENPGVFVMLANKKGPGWWELPGGKIEGTPSTPEDFRDEAEREWREEVQLDTVPNSTSGVISLARFDPYSTSDIIVAGNKSIITHPFIIRQTYDALPRIQAYVPEKDQGPVDEHDGYWWLDMSPIYYQGNLTPRQDLEREFQTQNKAILSFWYAWQDIAQNSLHFDGSEETLQRWGVGTYSARQAGDLTESMSRMMPVSIVSARVLQHYVSPNHSMEPPSGMGRPQFKPFQH